MIGHCTLWTRRTRGVLVDGLAVELSTDFESPHYFTRLHTDSSKQVVFSEYFVLPEHVELFARLDLPEHFELPDAFPCPNSLSHLSNVSCLNSRSLPNT